MPSRFLILSDGRCFSRRWSVHDCIVQAVPGAVANDGTGRPLRQWLIDRLPKPGDIEELGYGAWSSHDGTRHAVRRIDLRLMTVGNQRLLGNAARRAAFAERHEGWLTDELRDLADMLARAERAEDPLSKSDWGVRSTPAR